MDMDNLKWTKYGEGNDWVIDLWVWVGEGAVSPKLAQWQREIHPPTHARTLSRPSGQGRLLMWSKPTTSGVQTPAESNPIGHRLPSPNQTMDARLDGATPDQLGLKTGQKKSTPTSTVY